MVKNLPAMQETWVWSLDQEDSLKKGMASYFSILGWRILQTEEPDRLQSMGSQKVGHHWATNASTLSSYWVVNILYKLFITFLPDMWVAKTFLHFLMEEIWLFTLKHMWLLFSSCTVYLFFFCCHWVSESCKVVSDSLWTHGLYSPWNSPGYSNAVGTLSLLQGLFPTQGSNLGLLHCRRVLYQLNQIGVVSKKSVPNWRSWGFTPIFFFFFFKVLAYMFKSIVHLELILYIMGLS